MQADPACRAPDRTLCSLVKRHHLLVAHRPGLGQKRIGHLPVKVARREIFRTKPIHHCAELGRRPACARTNRRSDTSCTAALFSPIVRKTRPPTVVERRFQITAPCNASHNGRIMMNELATLDEQYRAPQAREVEAGCRAARSRADHDDVPQVTFSLLRSDFPRKAAHHTCGVPLNASPAFSYMPSMIRAVNRASSGPRASDFLPLMARTKSSSWSW